MCRQVFENTLSSSEVAYTNQFHLNDTPAQSEAYGSVIQLYLPILHAAKSDTLFVSKEEAGLVLNTLWSVVCTTS